MRLGEVLSSSHYTLVETGHFVELLTPDFPMTVLEKVSKVLYYQLGLGTGEFMDGRLDFSTPVSAVTFMGTFKLVWVYMDFLVAANAVIAAAVASLQRDRLTALDWSGLQETVTAGLNDLEVLKPSDLKGALARAFKNHRDFTLDLTAFILYEMCIEWIIYDKQFAAFEASIKC